MQSGAQHPATQKSACSVRSDASIGVFVVVNGIDGIGAPPGGSGGGVNNVSGSRSCGEIGGGSLRLFGWEFKGNGV